MDRSKRKDQLPKYNIPISFCTTAPSFYGPLKLESAVNIYSLYYGLHSWQQRGQTPKRKRDCTSTSQWLAALLNELSRSRLEFNISEQVRFAVAGMCWALSPEEYEDLRTAATQHLNTHGPDFSHEQQKYIRDNLRSWIAEFKAGPQNYKHPSQRPEFEPVDLYWPLIRKERIQELDELYPLYSDSGQRKNIIAAKEYHSQFPADEIVPVTEIMFKNGKQIDESESPMHYGLPWFEGGFDELYLGC